MAKFTVNKTEDYSIIANSVFKDKRLSWKAKGLLTNMLALPADWDYSMAGLVTLADDGESAVRTGLKELEKFGYLKRTPVREQGKIVDWEYSIYEKPVVENPQVVNPQVENQTQYNTKKSKTKKLNNIAEINSTAEDVLIYLNEKAGTRFRPVESNLKFIKARLKDYSIERLKAVIDLKVKEWRGTKMQPYLRPETLFNATKFEAYSSGLQAPHEQSDINKRAYSKEDYKNMIQNVDEIIL